MLVVLTFDDMSQTHYDIAFPILVKYGFGATFYVMDFPDTHDKNNFLALDLPETARLSHAGFEIGNHTADHANLNKLTPEKILHQIERVESRCDAAGIPKPVTFAYPGGPYCKEAADILRKRGYIGARTNIHTHADPVHDDKFAVPAFPVAAKYPGIFEDAMNAPDGRVPVLIYHGLPDAYAPASTSPDEFAAQMKHLHETGARVVSMKEYLSGNIR